MLPVCSLLFVSVTALAWTAGDPPSMFGRYLSIHLALTIVMLLAWATDRGTRRELVWLLGAAVVARLVLLGAPTTTSTDSIRYLWDGRVLLSGLDPWGIPPRDPRLAALAATWPIPPIYSHLPTVYPPGAVAAFALAAAAGAKWAPLVWQALLSAAGIATVLLMARTSRRHLALVAFSPLLVLETGVGRHVDAFAGLGVAAALYLARGGASAPAGAALAAGALAKPLCLAALPALVASASRARARGRVAAAAATVVGTSYVAMLAAGLRPVGSLPDFLRGWRFGAPLFTLLCATVGEAGAWLMTAVVIGIGGAMSIWLARRRSVGHGLVVGLGATLAASPVVFPWYLMPLVPAVALAPSAAALAWLSTVPLTYEADATAAAIGTWLPAEWPLWVIALAVAAGAFVDAVRLRQRRSQNLAVSARGRVAHACPPASRASEASPMRG